MFELPFLSLQGRYARVQRAPCHEFGVSLVPRNILAGAIASPGHTLDGLHLTPAGHRWLATRVGEWWRDNSAQ